MKKSIANTRQIFGIVPLNLLGLVFHCNSRKKSANNLKRHVVVPKFFVSSYVGVSLNGGTPKSSILIGFSIINHPFWDTLIFGNIHI